MSSVFYRLLDKKLRVILIIRMFGRAAGSKFGWWNVLRRQDWNQVDSAANYRYQHSRLHLLVWALTGMFFTAAVAGLVITDGTLGPTWLAWVIAVIGTLWLLVIFAFSWILEDNSEEYPEYFAFLPFTLRWASRRVYYYRFDRNEFTFVVATLTGSAAFTALPVVVGAQFVGVWAAVGIVLLAQGVTAALTWYGLRRERSAANPFRGLLEFDDAAHQHSSIITF